MPGAYPATLLHARSLILRNRLLNGTKGKVLLPCHTII